MTKWALLGWVSPGGTGEPRYQAKVCGDHEFTPGGPIGGCWDQIYSPGALRGPPKSPKETFRALLEPPGAQKWPDTRSKCVVTMTIQLWQLAPNLAPRDPPRTFGAPKQKGLSGQKCLKRAKTKEFTLYGGKLLI